MNDTEDMLFNLINVLEKKDILTDDDVIKIMEKPIR